MSRIGKAPIAMPSGVEVKSEGDIVTVKGPKGELTQVLVNGLSVKVEDGQATIEVAEGRTDLSALSGTSRALINNMITGVSEGFERKLTIVGVGYRAQAQGSEIKLQLGFSHDVAHQLPAGISAETPSQTEIVLKGIDKQLLGQTAANIRSYRPPEPYKGKGIRYAEEHVVRKQAKKA
ncbi:MAG: large subunit ribosomal protein L6 [Gammaproteobacteria bacterium]|jgi:large subunit ribosomal protein L6